MAKMTGAVRWSDYTSSACGYDVGDDSFRADVRNTAAGIRVVIQKNCYPIAYVHSFRRKDGTFDKMADAKMAAEDMMRQMAIYPERFK